MMTDKVYEHKFSKTYNTDMSLFGSFPTGDCLHIEVHIPRHLGASGLIMYIHPDGMDFPQDSERCFEAQWTALKKARDVYTLTLDLDELCKGVPERRLFYYCWCVEREKSDGNLYLGGEEPTELLPTDRHGDRQLLVFDRNFTTSAHLKQGLIYHIFVDRFRKSGRTAPRGEAVINEDWDNGIPQFAPYPGAKLKNNVFFGGDLFGVIEKLEYIHSLGVKTIYLSPVFEAASNHKYDTGDYLKVDSMFGGDEALKELTEKARRYDIDIILDGVFNHTGSDSVYFNREGHYPPQGAYNTRCSPYFGWYDFREYPDSYACWWDIDILPRVNSADDSYLDFINGKVITKWMKMGISGWRLDVADELSNSFLDRLRSTARKINPDAPIIGEVWEDTSCKIAYSARRRYFQGRQLDSVMNYPLRTAIIDFVLNGDAQGLRTTSEGLYRRYPKAVSDCLMNFLGSHDTERILTVLGGEPRGDRTNEELSVARMSADERALAVKRLKFAFALLAAFPGVPCVFYGDEAGLEGYSDPFCRMPYPWNNQNKELLEHYRTIGGIRSEEQTLKNGLFEVAESNEDIFTIRRYPQKDENGREILIIANRSDETKDFDFSCCMQELISGKYGQSLSLAPLTVGYFVKA